MVFIKLLPIFLLFSQIVIDFVCIQVFFVCIQVFFVVLFKGETFDSKTFGQLQEILNSGP